MGCSDISYAYDSSSLAGQRFGQAIAMLGAGNDMPSVRPYERPAGSPVPPAVIPAETAWRRPPASPGSVRPAILATRWESSEHRIHEVSAETAADCYLIGLVLRPTDIRLSVSGQVVQDGVASAGMIHVSEPSASAHCLFRGPYDLLHLHVPNDVLIECAGRHSDGNAIILRSRSTLERDPIALQLGLALLKAEEFGNAFGQIYADGISLAIVTRLLALQAKGQTSGGRNEVVALSKWRLKRAIEFIDAHLDEPVSLAEVAAATGLSRMHFAAQFKAATGYRPHEYLLRRRISRAQEVMAASDVPLVQVSLQVGFQSQAHFTTVFKRIVGQPPHAWRRSRDPYDCRPL
jgi:AraC-like DNA-binding protein